MGLERNVKRVKKFIVCEAMFEVITMCGSTKFKDEFWYWAKELSLDGWIVIMPYCFGHVDSDKRINEKKYDLDVMHFHKIDMSNAIFVVDKNGYIGDSTTREIVYAKHRGKQILYMSKEIERRKNVRI